MSDGGYKTMEKAFFEAQDEIDRLKNELKEAHVATDFANLACDRKDEEIVRLKEKHAKMADHLSELVVDLHARDKALVEAREALEYCGCHEHYNETAYPPSESHKRGKCQFCEHVDRALATLTSLLGDKCGVAAPPPDNQKGGS